MREIMATARKFGKDTYFSVKTFYAKQDWGFSSELRDIAIKKLMEDIEAMKNTMPGYKFRIAKYPGDVFRLFAKAI